MEKVKLFYSYDMDDGDDDVKDLQKEINKWYAKNPDIDIKQRIHTFSDETFLIAIYYESSKSGVEL
jgi:hypothetical protein